MNILSILHIAAAIAIGIIVGLWLRKLQPGPEPMELSWSIAIGILGSLVVSLFGALVGMYPLGGFLYYASSPTGATIALILYNIAIAKE